MSTSSKIKEVDTNKYLMSREKSIVLMLGMFHLIFLPKRNPTFVQVYNFPTFMHCTESKEVNPNSVSPALPGCPLSLERSEGKLYLNFET